jgi:hypothetical protein
MIWRWINLQPLLIALVLLAPTLSLSAYVHAAVELIAIGDADRLEPRFAGIEKEIHLLLDGEKMGSTVSVRHHVIPSSLSPDRIRSEVRKLAKSHPTSLWVALDPLSAQELGASRVIAAPRTSEVIRDISEDLRSFREIVPFSSVSVLADNSFIQGVKDLRKKVERLQEELSLRITLEPLPGPRAEAVYFSPLFDLPRAQSASLIRDLTKRKVPTFSSHAAGLSQEGVLAGKVNDPEDPSGIREARRIALDVQHVLLGTPRATALSLPVSYRLAINLDTARLIGVDPTFDVLRNATILGTATEPGKYDETPASPREIVEEAIKNNLNLASSGMRWESREPICFPRSI